MIRIREVLICLAAGVSIVLLPLSVSAANGQVIISNESVEADQRESVGALSVEDEQYTKDRSLSREAYQMDVHLPYDTEKNEEKVIEAEPSTRSLNVAGNAKNFSVYDFTQYREVQMSAELLYAGGKANVWVNDKRISRDAAKRLGMEFERRIYPSVTSNFAKESDVDGDGKINILCYDIKDGFDGYGYIAGYFDPKDLYAEKGSNRSEIFYIDTYPTMGMGPVKDVTAAFETLAHEFQHMVNFNQNVFVEKGQPMDTWLNEGLSMAAEQIYSGKVLADRIDYYNASYSIATGHSLLYWDDYGDVLSNYSLSYLFTQYMRTQSKTGNEIFKEILLDKNNDYKAVENVAKRRIDPSLTFGKLMTNYRGALLRKERTGPYGFMGEKAFNQVKTTVLRESPSRLRGGGAVAAVSAKKAVPASKGQDVTYTFFAPPGKPAVSLVSDKDTKVGGKAAVGTTVYVKAGSKQLGKTTVLANRTFTVLITKQKAGTKLSVYATDIAGLKSDVTSMTVADKTAPAMPTASKISNRDKKVIGKAEAGSKIAVKAGSKVIGTATADKKGSYAATFKTAQKAGSTIYITATDKAKNTSKARKIVVADKIAPKPPKVNKVTYKSTKITGAAEANSTVYGKAGKKTIGTATASKKGTYSIKMKKLKTGTTIHVYAKDKAGNVSKAAKVTVRKR